MPDLSSLPEELFCTISGFVHPQTIIDWACTCKVLFRCSLQALKTHRQRQSELRVVHDRNPITIPSLLQNIFSAPETSWYVRSLDIWELREKFEKWKSPHFTAMNPYHWESEESLNWPEKHYDYSHLDITFYSDEELERYSSILSTMLHLNELLVDEWMERLQSGSDEPLKVLLMAMSPELTKATFVGHNTWQPRSKKDPFAMLASTLRALAPLPSPKWQCFQNLRIVCVGQFTELRAPYDNFYPSFRVIAPLLLLPAIEELHLNLLIGEDPESYVWQWETGRSSCRVLNFNCCELDTKTIASFIGATHSLRYLSRVSNEKEVIPALLEHSSHSLESVSFEEPIPGPTCWGNLPRHSLQTFQRLGNIELPHTQLIDNSTYRPSYFAYTADHRMNLKKTDFGTMDWLNLLDFLPPTLQTLKVNKSYTPLFEHQAFGLMHQLVVLVNAKRFPTNGAFASLTEICLAHLSIDVPTSRWGAYPQIGLDPWLGNLRWRCGEAKVKLHTERFTTCIDGPSGDSFPCSFCQPRKIDPDSAPVIPEEN